MRSDAPSLVPLFPSQHQDELLTWLYIYGSWAARHEGEPGAPPNDVDILVIGTPLRAAAYEASDAAQDRLGLPVNPTIRSPQEWQDASDALIQQIKASPLVIVIHREPWSSGGKT